MSAPRSRSESRPKSAWVSIDDVLFDARFGHWRVSTPLANITEVEVTGPYRFFKTGGPARLAITDRGLTFATNGDRGVRIGFRTPVPGLDRLGVLRHPELTVTVADIDRLFRGPQGADDRAALSGLRLAIR